MGCSWLLGSEGGRSRSPGRGGLRLVQGWLCEQPENRSGKRRRGRQRHKGAASKAEDAFSLKEHFFVSHLLSLLPAKQVFSLVAFQSSSPLSQNMS